MGKSALRRNGQLLRWLRAAAYTAVAATALNQMAFNPSSVAVAIALAAGVVSLFAPGMAILIIIVAMSLPLLAANFLVGVVFLIVGFASIQYLGQNNGRAFLLIALAFVGAIFGPAWAAVVLAGYLLGASEGAVTAILACVALQGAGLVLGHEQIGMVFTGGTAPGLVSFNDAPANLLAFGWLGAALDTIDAGALLKAFTGASTITLLIVQPAIWGAGAAITGSVKRPAEDPRRGPIGLLAVLIGVGVVAMASIIAGPMLSDSYATTTAVSAAIGSLLLGLIVVAAWEWIFPPTERRIAPAVRPGTMSAEDADVDELLRLIATAEDQLASKHTTNAFVMITDMKSFSKMTEEDGSFVSAKTIQRHRDLLLPVIVEHNGNGKSTGGDGLVAAFPTSTDALNAAAVMQRRLREYNGEHETERDIIVRCGIASGEVVLDKGGRPFIGEALNMSARIMNLADGGQILVTRPVIEKAGALPDIRLQSHGAYTLKNIAEPTEAIEILWAADQQPLEPQGIPAGTIETEA